MTEHMTEQLYYTLRCEKCDLAVTKLLTIFIDIFDKKTNKTIKKKKMVCRFCKKEFIQTGKLTRKKVIHDYKGALNSLVINKKRDIKTGKFIK